MDGQKFMSFSGDGLIRAAGMTLGQPATLVQTGLNASTVVPLGPGTVATPGGRGDELLAARAAEIRSGTGTQATVSPLNGL